MIIEMLLNVIYNLINKLVILDIPNLPDEVYGYIDTLFDYLTSGASILANYTPYAYMMTLFTVILAVDIGINIYKFVMWVLQKIPFIDID